MSTVPLFLSRMGEDTGEGDRLLPKATDMVLYRSQKLEPAKQGFSGSFHHPHPGLLPSGRREIAFVVLLLVLCAPVPGHAACTLRVATSGDYAPFSLRTATGEYEGLDIDIARRLGTDLGCEITFVPFNWPALNAKLQAGEIDLVASGITMRPERALVGRFSRPYAMTGALALVRSAEAKRFDTLNDLNKSGVRVAVNAGGHLERVARALLPSASIRPQRDNRALPKVLRDGDADAVITDSAEARAWLADDLRALGPFTNDHKALLVSVGSGDLITRIDAWLRAREDDGWLAQQRTRYLGEAVALDARRANREAVAALIRLRLELMPAVGAVKRTAKLPIEDKTQERRVLVRVAATNPAHPDRLAKVYGQLIAFAKAVQHAHPNEKASASLESLRDAITRIDEQLVREIDTTQRAAREEWQPIIDAAIAIAGVDAAMRDKLVQALCTDS